MGWHTARVPWAPLPTADGPGRRPGTLAEGLDRVLAGLGAPAADVISTIRDRWPDLVGPAAAAALVPIAVERGKIVLVTASGAWASQARWLEADLVARAADLLGEGVVRGLTVRVEPASG